MERDSSPGPTAEEARVPVSCQALYPVIRLVCGEQQPACCLLGLAHTQFGSGDFFRNASSCIAVRGAEEIHSPKSSSALPSLSVLCGQGRMVIGRCFTAWEMSVTVLPPCCPRSVVAGCVIIQDLDVTPNSRCQRKCLRNPGSVLPPEKVCPDGLLCCVFSSGHHLSARASSPVPSPPAKQGPV